MQALKITHPSSSLAFFKSFNDVGAERTTVILKRPAGYHITNFKQDRCSHVFKDLANEGKYDMISLPSFYSIPMKGHYLLSEVLYP